MGFLKRLAMLAGVIEPTTIDDQLDQLIADAVQNGFEAEYDEADVRLTDVATRACYCADYRAYPPSLDGARVWMNDRIAARKSGPQFPIAAEALYKEGR